MIFVTFYEGETNMLRRLMFSLVLPLCLVLTGCAMVTKADLEKQNEAGKLTNVQFYVPSEQDHKISIIDIPSSEVVGEIKTGKKPANVVFSSTMRNAYVANQNSSTVGVIDTKSLKMTKEIEVGPRPHGVALTPDNKKLYVTAVGDQYVYVIDTEKEKVVNEIDMGAGAKTNYLALHEDRLFVSDHENNRVYVVENDKKVDTLETKQTPRVVRTNQDDSKLYVASAGSSMIEVFDTKSLKKDREVQVGEGATDFVLKEDGTQLVSTNMEAGSVTITDLQSNETLKTIEGLESPKHISFNRKQTKAYVTLNGTNKVAVVDMEKQEVIETIEVGEAPHGIEIKALPGIGGSC